MELEDIPDTAILTIDTNNDNLSSYIKILCINLYDAESADAVQVPPNRVVHGVF